MGEGKVLVVDDQSGVREVLEVILKRAGYQTASVGSGEEALQMMSKESFDVLLADIRMHGMSGLDLVERVRQVSPDTVSILITAYPSVDSIEQAMTRLGVHEYLLKPVDKDKLCNAVAGAVGRKRLVERPRSDGA